MKFGKKKEKDETAAAANGAVVSPTKKEKEKKDKKKKSKENGESTNNNSSAAASTTSSSSNSGTAAHPNGGSGKVFGSKIIDNMEIPPIIIQTIEYLEANALQTSGIFRESGSQQLIQQYKAQFEQEKPVVFQPHESHVVASILKSYLRELQDPLLSFENYNMFVACESINDEKVKLEVVKKVLKLLPMTNLKIIKYIFEFLVKVVANSDTNKMTTDSLSVVFLPTILRPETHTDQQMLQFTVEDSKSTKTLMATIIGNYESIFEDQALFVRSRQTRAITEFTTPNIHVKYPQQLYKAPLPAPPLLTTPPTSSTSTTPSLISPRSAPLTTTPLLTTAPASPSPAITTTTTTTSNNISPNTTPSSTPTSTPSSTPNSSFLTTTPPPLLEIPSLNNNNNNNNISPSTSPSPSPSPSPSKIISSDQQHAKSLPAIPDKRLTMKLQPPPLPAKPPSLFVPPSAASHSVVPPKPLPHPGWYGDVPNETRARSHTTAV